MSEERKRILKMVENGKIDVEEAEKLLQSLNSKTEKNVKENNVKFIKINVEEDGEEKVNISVPIALAKSILKFIPKSAKESLEENEVEVSKIIEAIENLEAPSTIVDVNDDDEHVQIRLE